MPWLLPPAPPKYITLHYQRDRWQVMSGCLLVHECTFAYQLSAWMARWGYAAIATNLYERSIA